ncbi:hypothetical protein ACH9D2_07145 [Kocuria sp. M4R2S49]|uniref:hypothetical protein n=1 Tax=Kocuria rhizosphaericola TaxID=3376284 RepID=UPI0037ACD0B8
MNKRILSGIAATTFAATMAFAAPALAAVTFDPATGNGFVGKGDVQLAFGWNNKQLQDNAGQVDFEAVTESTTVGTWTCDRDAGPQTQERSRTTTTTTSGVVDAIARERNQITGFTLSGYSGTPVEVVTGSDGPAYLTCPTGWTAINPEQTTETGPTTLYVKVGDTRVAIG